MALPLLSGLDLNLLMLLSLNFFIVILLSA